MCNKKQSIRRCHWSTSGCMKIGGCKLLENQTYTLIDLNKDITKKAQDLATINRYNIFLSINVVLYSAPTSNSQIKPLSQLQHTAISCVHFPIVELPCSLDIEFLHDELFFIFRLHIKKIRNRGVRMVILKSMLQETKFSLEWCNPFMSKLKKSKCSTCLNHWSI